MGSLFEMENSSDFIQWLGADMSAKILMCLEDPSDLIRASLVSRFWRQFVISNGLCKQLCLIKFPEMSSAIDVIEVNKMLEPVQLRPKDPMEWVCLERNHRVYAFLARGFTSFMRKDCIAFAISASSTDNYPQEDIQNTLEPRDRVDRASYWSSKGESDPAIPENLIYKLVGKLCLITEIHVQPFQAYFQFGYPIYSAKAVRFRMGRPRFPVEAECDITVEPAAAHESADEKYAWTYTSPEFPMAQENRLQKFKLPEAVLCIGGILQVELLGRVQRQEIDGLYYICISHVQVVGRSLLPAFDAEILYPSEKCSLKYCPDQKHRRSPTISSEGAASRPSRFRTFTTGLVRRSLRGWEQMIRNRLLGGGAVVVIDDDSDDEPLG